MIKIRVFKSVRREGRTPQEIEVGEVWADAVPDEGHLIDLPGLVSARVTVVEWFPYRSEALDISGLSVSRIVLEPTIIVEG